MMDFPKVAAIAALSAAATAAAYSQESAAQDAATRGGAAKIAAWEEHRGMTAALPKDAPAWRALGPKNCGGRIEAVDSPRGKPSIIYAGVGSGGVWKSVNGGLSWTHVFAREATCAIGDVTVDPSDENIIWVGTGEAHLGGMSYDGTGVYRSVDAGATWEHMGLTDSARIGKVLVHPEDSDTLHVAVIGPRRGEHQGRGVHMSRDGGATWEHTLFPGAEVGVIDLARDPFHPDRLWAAAWDRRREGKGGVFRSDDGGVTWARQKGGLLEGSDVGRVALAASAAEEGVVYALMVDHSPPGDGRYDVGGALFRSDDGGDTWARTSDEYVDTYVGWDFCDVMTSPDNADEVYVCGFRLMASRDGGASFERGGEDVFRLLEHPGKGMHLDMHDLWIDPGNPDRILLGTDGGLYESKDRAKTWLHLNNLPIAEFYTVHLDGAEPFRIWGGTQDNASLTAPSSAALDERASDDWSYVYLDPWDGGDGFATFPDPSGDGTVYYEHQMGDMRRKRPGAPLRWGKDSGRRITPRAGQGEPKLRFAWNTPLLPSARAGTLYCAAQRVFRSENRGDTWTAISGDLTGGRGAILSLAESPLDSQRLGAGSGQGRVSLTSDGGQTWNEAGPGLPEAKVQKVLLSRHEPSRVYVCLSAAGSGDHRPLLYVSEDFGATWSSIGTGLPTRAINVVTESAEEGQVIYAGTDLGVYESRDMGSTWASLSRGLPTVPVMDLALHAKSSTLVAVTHGLSAFALDIPEKVVQWNGYKRLDITVAGKNARLVVPEHPAPGRPWVWRARFPDFHTGTDRILLERGFHIAFINTGGMLGGPKAMGIWDEFYDLMTEEHGLAPRVALEGVSRGGLFVYHWASRHPERVACIYADTPVCNIRSWPLGDGSGRGHAPTWRHLLEELELTEDEAKAYALNPIELLGPIAEAGVPLLSIVSLNDEIVPPAENTAILAERFRALGGEIEVMEVAEGTQKSGGHHFTHPDPLRPADFIELHTSAIDAGRFQVSRAPLQNSLARFQAGGPVRAAFLGGSITHNPGWRDQTCAYLEERFPDAEFSFVAAGIPSTGSTPGAFRLRRDVFGEGQVDLLFIEAAVNDSTNGRSPREMTRGMEGIMRGARLTNPAIDLVVMHFVDPSKMKAYRSGSVPEVILQHEAVAQRYGASTVHLAHEVTARIDAGQFRWKEDFRNLHPSPFGQRLYAGSIRRLLNDSWQALERAAGESSPIKVTNHELPQPLDPHSYFQGALLDPSEGSTEGGFELVPSCDPRPGVGGGVRDGFVGVPMLVGASPGDELSLPFEGRGVGIWVAAGPDAGTIEFSVDAAPWQTLDLFTRWSGGLHLPWVHVLAAELPTEAPHLLKLRVTADQNPKSKGHACRIVHFAVNE